MHVFNDGGRFAAGYKGKVKDCVVRAIAIAADKPYLEVYDAINLLGQKERITRTKRSKSSARDGVYTKTIRKYLAHIGWQWHPTMGIGTGCTVHLRADELPSGRIIVKLSRHVAAVIDGVVHDTHDPSRNGTRCVYGYWTQS